MQITAMEAEAWTLALRAPFVIATRMAHHAHNVLIRLHTDDGDLQGVGESAPVAYVSGESVGSVLACMEEARPRLIGQPIERLWPLLEIAAGVTDAAPAARAGLEMALFDLWACRWNIPLWQHFGGRTRTLTTDLTIPIVAPDEARARAAEAAAEGFAHFKIKVGDAQGPEADLARVRAITDAAPQAALRIDANQAFSPDDALRFITAVAQTGARVDLVEQPVAKMDIDGLAYVARRSPFPVFADEAACDPASVLRLIDKDAVHGVNVKLMKSGICGALQIISLCQAAGKKLMLGCMLESPLGIGAAAQIAGGMGAFDFLDLDSHRLLAPLPDLTGGFDQTGSMMHILGASPGWGADGAPRIGK